MDLKELREEQEIARLRESAKIVYETVERKNLEIHNKLVDKKLSLQNDLDDIYNRLRNPIGDRNRQITNLEQDLNKCKALERIADKLLSVLRNWSNYSLLDAILQLENEYSSYDFSKLRIKLEEPEVFLHL